MTQSRKISSTNLYHVTSRGVGGQIIFEDDADRRHFLVLLKRAVGDNSLKLAAWCLMDNHIHLIVQADSDDLSSAMRLLIGRYARDANKRYQRSGHLFQGKYSSFPIEDESYLAAAVQYVHFNPVRAGIVSTPIQYPWSSVREYEGKPVLIDESLMPDLPSDPPAVSAVLPILYHGARISDDRAALVVCSLAHVNSPTEIKSLPRERRDQVVRAVSSAGIGTRQISRLTGISASVVCGIVNSKCPEQK